MAVFVDFTVRDEILTLLKTTTKAVDTYDVMKQYFTEKKTRLERLVSVKTDGAPRDDLPSFGFLVALWAQKNTKVCTQKL